MSPLEEVAHAAGHVARLDMAAKALETCKNVSVTQEEAREFEDIERVVRAVYDSWKLKLRRAEAA